MWHRKLIEEEEHKIVHNPKKKKKVLSKGVILAHLGRNDWELK